MAENHSKGLRTDNARRRWPHVASAFNLYLSCRNLQLFHMEVQKDKRVTHKVVQYPTGYSMMPGTGGLLDQDAWLMDLFDSFLAGERTGVLKELKK